MEEIEVLNGELQRLAKQIEEKRTEMIVAKLKKIQENGISEISELTEEENELLKTFLIQRGNPKSVMVQEEWYHSYWPEDSEYDYDITNCYLMIGDKIYYTRNNKFIQRDRIEEDYQTIDYDNEENNEEYKDDKGRRTLIGSKEELSESLNIEQLFEDILLKNGIKTIENIDKEILEVEQKIKNVRKEIIKIKLKQLQENGVSKESRLTREEQRLLSAFLKQRGDPKSVIVQNEWRYAYYPEDQGYDYESTDCYLMLGDKIYSTRDNKFVERNEIEEDFTTINDKEKDSGRDDVGRETLIGSKEGLTIPLNIEQLFDIEIEIDDDEEYEYDDQYEEDEYEYDEEECDPYKEMEDLARYEDEKRQEFIWSLMKDDVVEFHLTKDPADLINFVDTKILRMIGFDQKNSHHCYDLWEHTLRTVEGIKPDGLTEEQFEKLRVAAFFHDIGKLDVAKFNEQTGQQVFYGHAMQSAQVAKPILEKLGYGQEEISQIEFYIGHHDDFISYKSKLEPFMVNHEFIRGISPESVAEKMIENKFDFEKMGYNKDQIRVICYTLANGKKPEFRTKDGPIEIPVDMEEVKEKINSQKYNMPYDASVEDYKMLLKLCKADAGAQSEIAMQNGRQVGSKAEKLENMDNIESVVIEADKIVTDVIAKIPQEIKKAVEQYTGYSFEEFISETKNGFKRPRVVMGDGVSLYVQASAFHHCEPRRSGLDSYESYEVGYPSEIIEQLIEYVECPVEKEEELLKSIYPYVPAEVLSEIVMEHGGIDKEATLYPEKKLDGYKEEKQGMEDKNKKAQEMINQLMAQIGNILEDYGKDEQ